VTRRLSRGVQAAAFSGKIYVTMPDSRFAREQRHIRARRADKPSQ